MPPFKAAGTGGKPRDSLQRVALTAAQVNRILSLRGRLVPGIPDTVPDETELRLRIDRVLAYRRRPTRSEGSSPYKDAA